MKPNEFYFCTEKQCFNIFYNYASHSYHQSTLEKLPLELTINYEFKKKLKQGETSYVFEIFDKTHQSSLALKYDKNLSNFKEENIKELELLKKLSHPNIISHYHFAICSETKKFYILLERCDMNLIEYIEKQPLLNMDTKIKIFEQICAALYYLHNENDLHKTIVHQNLQMANILMKGNEVRISNFQISKQIDQNCKTSLLKTSPYLSLELLDKDNSMHPSTNQDIWALGIIAHELFSNGKHPFKIPSPDWIKNVRDGRFKIDSLIPNKSVIHQIITGCLEQNAEKRMRLKQILSLLSSETGSNLIFNGEPQKNEINKPTESSLKDEKNIDKSIQDDINLCNESQVKEKTTINVSMQLDANLSHDSQEKVLSPEKQKAFEKELEIIDKKVLFLCKYNIGDGPLSNVSLFIQYLENNKNLAILGLLNLGKGKKKNVELICETLKNNKNLKALHLFGNDLGKCDEMNIELLSEAIKCNENLQVLNLSGNELGTGKERNIELISDAIKNNSKLKELEFNCNALGRGNKRNIELIFQAIKNNKNLQILNLGCNEIGEGNQTNTCINLISEVIKFNESLQYLNLVSNNINSNTKDNFEALKNGRKLEIKY